VLCPPWKAVDAPIVILGDPPIRQRPLIRVCTAHRRPARVAGPRGGVVEVQAFDCFAAAVRKGNRFDMHTASTRYAHMTPC